MEGIIQRVLISRYGPPRTICGEPFSIYEWNGHCEPRKCTLYSPLLGIKDGFQSEYPELLKVYGDACGGFLLRDSLKMAMLTRPEVWGLYQIRHLWVQPEVLDALACDPEVVYFMDAANVWFYGMKADRLCVYDSETKEFDMLGDAESALHILLDQWETAREFGDFGRRDT